MFYNTKIKRYKVDPRIDPASVKQDFDVIDGFNKEVSKYIYTDIKIGPESDIEVFIQSRMQMFLSQTLLRALFLKEELVHSLNTNNFPAFYAVAKSFMEIPAQLGYATYILYESKSDDEIREALSKLIFAHRGGLTEVPNAEPISVMKMFDKLDHVLREIALTQAISEEEKVKIRKDQVMRTMYEDVCNFGHPNYMAHLSVGGMNNLGYWRAKTPSTLKNYKFELYAGFYMHHFTTSIGTILVTANMIARHAKVDHFKKLKSPLLFDSHWTRFINRLHTRGKA